MASPMACSVATLLVAFLSLSCLPLETTARDRQPPWPTRLLLLHSPPPPVPSLPRKHRVPPSPTTSSGLDSATSTPPLEEPDKLNMTPPPPKAPVRRLPPLPRLHPPPPPPPLPQLHPPPPPLPRLHPPPPPPPIEEPYKFTKELPMGPVRGVPPLHPRPVPPPLPSVGQYKIKRPRPWPALQAHRY